MTARDEWRWTDERGVQRLVGTDELRAALASSVLPPSTLVWREGMKEWAPAFTMPELASAAIAAARGGGDSEPGVDNTPTEVDVPAGRIPGPAGRGEMRTLLGLSAPESKDRQSAPNLPIVVPAAGGATAGAREVITQLPKFNAEPTEASPAIPAAPRMPGRPTAPASKAPAHPGSPTGSAAEPLANMPKQRQRTQTMQGVGLQRGSGGALRTKTTSDIDSLWAAPSSEPPPSLGDRTDSRSRSVEPDFTKQRPAAGAPAVAPPDDAGDWPSSTEVDEVEISPRVRVPAPPRMPDFRSGARTGTRPPGPPPKAPAGARKPLSSMPPPLPKRQPSIPPGVSGKPDALEKSSLKAPPTGFDDVATGRRSPPVDSRAPGMRPQAPPLPPKRGSERPPMPSTPPPGPAKRSHPPPPLKSRGPLPSTPPLDAPPAAVEPSPEAEAAAKAALDAVDVEITADALAEASSTPAPVAASETKPVEPTPATAKAEKKPEAKPAATAAPQPASATTPAASAAAAKTSTPAPAKTATPTPAMASVGVDAKPSVGSTAPSPPTKHSATATPAPVVAQASEAAEAPPPVAPKPRVDPILASSVTPPPAQIAIRNKADLSGTPTAPVAPPDAIRSARPQAAEPASDSDAPIAPPRRLGESVNVPVSSLMIAGGALIAMAMTGFLVGRSSSSTGAPPRAQSGIHLLIGTVRAASPTKLRPCGVSLSPQRWAPRASKSIPFELFATPSGKLAVGYARDDNEAAGIEVDPATADIKETFSKDTSEQIEHVMPNPSGGFTVIAPGDSAVLKNAIEVPTSTPFYVGISDGSVVSSDKADAAGPKLWPLPASDAINSERVEEAAGKGFAYTFRQGNDVFGGWLDAGRRPMGELAKIVGSGGSVGKPMSAFNGKETAVIFADRPASSKNWQIRIAHAPAGAIPTQTKVIPLPKGGPGGDAFAPDLAGLPDGRWVLVWTEGPPGGRAVRAQTLSPAFEPIGSPMALSPPAGNYGQGVIGVVGDRATVVFLSKGSQSFELWGAVLQCG